MVWKGRLGRVLVHPAQLVLLISPEGDKWKILLELHRLYIGVSFSWEEGSRGR